MPSGSDSYCIIAQGSSHRAGVLAPSWGILYVQSSNSVTQFQWNPSLMKQREGYSLRPVFVETGLAFWGNMSYVSSMCNGLGLQCGISSKNMLRMQASQTSRRLVSLPLLEVPESWVKWQRFALGAFLFLFTRDPRLLSMLSSGSWWPELASWVFPLHHQTVLLPLTYQSLLPSTLFPQDPEWASRRSW